MDIDAVYAILNAVLSFIGLGYLFSITVFKPRAPHTSQSGTMDFKGVHSMYEM